MLQREEEMPEVGYGEGRQNVGEKGEEHNGGFKKEQKLRKEGVTKKTADGKVFSRLDKRRN